MQSLEVIVPDDQLSLAIGKKGQNVRLAAKLTGWNIDIKSETRAAEAAMEEFAAETGLGSKEQSESDEATEAGLDDASPEQSGEPEAAPAEENSADEAGQEVTDEVILDAEQKAAEEERGQD